MAFLSEDAIAALGFARVGRNVKISDKASLYHPERISIADHGIGIPEENLTRIFDPYFTTKERGSQKGMGLGLAICHSIIHNHGGLITVESRKGVGTTFYIYLPAVEDKSPLSQARA